jgi:uncharacterized protein (TIGR02145 family)
MKMLICLSLCGLILGLGLFACSGKNADDDDGDAGADADTDADTDVDSDADSDGDSDACDGVESVEDYDGNVYATVSIGEHCWMAENLKTTHYSDGTEIPLVEDTGTWEANDSSSCTPAFCYYNNDEAMADTYGALYNWPAVMNGADWSEAVPSGVQGVCPEGWHVPSHDEWSVLANTYLGGWHVAGGPLKEAGTEHWLDPNEGATNESGFTALGAGKRRDNGLFVGLGEVGCFACTSAPINEEIYWGMYVYLTNTNTVLQYHGDQKNMAFSVRCLKD